jgi:hypothetical protein
MMRWIAGAFIVAHGLVTAMIWSAPPNGDAPFQASHSWLIGDARATGLVLAIVAAIGFAAAGVGVVAHQSWWAGFGLAAGGVAVALMVLYFNRWLVAGVAISAAIVFAGVQALQAA